MFSFIPFNRQKTTNHNYYICILSSFLFHRRHRIGYILECVVLKDFFYARFLPIVLQKKIQTLLRVTSLVRVRNWIFVMHRSILLWDFFPFVLLLGNFLLRYHVTVWNVNKNSSLLLRSRRRQRRRWWW